MTTYYTGKGDDGSTGTLGRCRINKDSRLANAVGDVDELNSVIGVAIVNTADERIAGALALVQDMLFTVGAELSASASGNKPKSTIKRRDVAGLEGEIDELGSRLPELKKFVLPGGSPSGAYLHLARSVARRAERSVISLSKESKLNPYVQTYLNRLSSFLFVAALYANKREGMEENHPTYL